MAAREVPDEPRYSSPDDRMDLHRHGGAVGNGLRATAPADRGSESSLHGQQVTPVVQVLDATPGDRVSSGSSSVQTTVPTETPPSTSTITPTEPPSIVPTQIPDLTPTAVPDSIHTELYEVINTIRTNPYVGQFPLDVDPGLEAAAQNYAEGGAWNTGLRVQPLLFEQGVRCRRLRGSFHGIPNYNVSFRRT